jgi:hypothetical protein
MVEQTGCPKHARQGHRITTETATAVGISIGTITIVITMS